MNLFYWRSDTLANYGKGHVIVMAETKQRAIELAVAQVLSCKAWFDVDEEREWEERLRRELEHLPEPTVYHIPAAILISGSE